MIGRKEIVCNKGFTTYRRITIADFILITTYFKKSGDVVRTT